jgi:uncharacterized protein (TIGR03083 family)
MMTMVTPADTIPPLKRPETIELAAAENRRVLELLVSLEESDWSKPTDCSLWDVRALAAHVLGGMEAFASFPEFVHQMRAAGKAAGEVAFIDAMTAIQVSERAALTRSELLERIKDVAPRAARRRARFPGLMRRMPMKQEVAGVQETWKMGYLLDIVLTRDTWMHRIDLARATGHPMVLTPEHDGRLIAEVVAEWARRHGQPFRLHLHGPAGGSYAAGHDGEEISLDAVEFCRVLAHRATGTGLLTYEVPF